MKIENTLPLIAVTLLLPVYAYFAGQGFAGLFVDEPGRRYARIQIEGGDWHCRRVEFFLDTPTICYFFVLLGGLFSLYGAARFYGVTHSKKTAVIVKYGLYQAVGLAVSTIATLIYLNDFFNTAFEGVG